MAWTLEATLVVPLAISLTTICLSMSAPLYLDARRAARLEVMAAVERASLESLYHTDRLSVDGIWSTGLRTSPRQVLELGSLLHDDIRLIESLFSGLESIDDPQVGEESAADPDHGAVRP